MAEISEEMHADCRHPPTLDQNEEGSGEAGRSLGEQSRTLIEQSTEESEMNGDISPAVIAPRLSARFLTSSDVKSPQGGDASGQTYLRYQIDKQLKSNAVECTLGAVVAFDIILSCIGIDMRAADLPTSPVVEAMSIACLAIYTVEMALQIYSRRMDMFKDRMTLLDVAILIPGYIEIVLQSTGTQVNQLGMLRIARVMRCFRMMRVIRKFQLLKELRKLMMMFASCLKTLAWSFLFCFVMMTMWSMAAVEIVNPIVQELADNGQWGGNEECRRSFSSVMRANLTLFKTVIAGDGWGQVAVPVIERSPGTSIIFCGSLISLVFGVLNLVVAIVVDSAAEQRQKDVMNLAMDMEADQQIDLQFLSSIFDQIDEDGSGELELEELINGARAVPEFQSRLRVMDIDEHDLEQLFHMLDEDHGGTISPEEFKYALSRWVNESKTAPRFIKYTTMQLAAESRRMENMLKQMNKKVDKLAAKMGKVDCEGSKPALQVYDMMHSCTEGMPQVAALAALEETSRGSPPPPLTAKDQANGADAVANPSCKAGEPSFSDSCFGVKVSYTKALNKSTTADSAFKQAVMLAARVAEQSLAASIHAALQALQASALEAADRNLQHLNASKASTRISLTSTRSTDTPGSVREVSVATCQSGATVESSPSNTEDNKTPNEMPYQELQKEDDEISIRCMV